MKGKYEVEKNKIFNKWILFERHGSLLVEVFRSSKKKNVTKLLLRKRERKMNEIQRTNSYDMFKQLKGNRGVNPKRVKKIKDSITEIGYIPNPIIVNEKFEVIDGQGRLQALRELGKPIEYIIIKGLGIKECLYMNINQEKWTMQDYIKSHAELGNVNYQRLLDLIELYPVYNLNTIGRAVKGINKLGNRQIQNGTIEISQYEYEQAIIKLNYLNRFISTFKYLKGRVTYFGQAVLVAYEVDMIDNERLLKQINENVSTMTPWSDFLSCLQSIEEVYNKQLGERNRVDLIRQYRIGLKGIKHNGIKEDFVYGDRRRQNIDRKLAKMNKRNENRG